MTDAEIEAILQSLYEQCEAASCPLSEGQQRILRLALQSWGSNQSSRLNPTNPAPNSALSSGENESGENGSAIDPTAENSLGSTLKNPLENPLEQLTSTERQALLEFIQQQETLGRPWKIALLNDWLQGQDSGSVQFIRDRYGIQWLDQITPRDLEQYSNSDKSRVLRLKVGDRIEVTNGLWEWVQESGPCSREWYPCTVVSVRTEDGDRTTSCVIRFDSGAEYEVQGVYDWNQPNWRWLQS